MFPRFRREMENHGIQCNFTPRTFQCLRQLIFNVIRMEEQGLMIGKEPGFHTFRCHFFWRFVEIQDIQTEITIVAATIPPVDMEETLVIKAIEHKGMTGQPHIEGGIKHGTMVLNLLSQQLHPIFWIVTIAIQPMHITITKGTAHWVYQITHISPTGSNTPTHVGRNATIIRQARHGIHFGIGIIIDIIIVTNQLAIYPRTRQNRVNLILLGFPSVKRILQNYLAAIVGNDFFQSRCYASHQTAVMRNNTIILVKRTAIIIGSTLVTHKGEQRTDSFR
ncbi:hypothetical protein EVA_00636 [gut metagenome]|uniref:Uncharacterized protein n=1 Tax=gut metagenome TaxID=749906 RepID=J9H8G6_9ZZZZ